MACASSLSAFRAASSHPSLSAAVDKSPTSFLLDASPSGSRSLKRICEDDELKEFFFA